MTWYADLSPCDYFGFSEPRLIAVGWLARDRAFSRGQVAAEVVNKLERLANDAPSIFVYRGHHVCELCGPEVDSRLTDDDGNRVPSSSHLNIFVPAEDRVFVAPQSLPHYITRHGYCPPAAFCDAVLNCPEPAEPLLALIRDVAGPQMLDKLERIERARTFLAEQSFKR